MIACFVNCYEKEGVKSDTPDGCPIFSVKLVVRC